MRGFAFALVLLSLTADADAAGRRRSVRSPGPDSPVATADAYSLNQGDTLSVPAPGVLSNDALRGASIVSFGPSTGAEATALGTTLQTTHGGSLRLTGDGAFTYTPASGFGGTDGFRYVVRNSGGSSTAAVSIDVRADATALAVTDSYSTRPDVALFVPAPGVLTNDTLAGGRIASFGPRDGTEQSALDVPSPTNQGGLVSLSGDGSFTYTPPPPQVDSYGYERPFLGPDSFSYTISSGAVSSTAMVNVDVEVALRDADFLVTTPGHYYSISGLSGENPVLVLTRGRTYVFQLSASSVHPFAILDAPAGSVTNNNITEGNLTFTVPMTAESYRYRCTTHGFGNVIQTVP